MELLDCVTITPELADSFAPLIPPSLLDGLRQETLLGLGSLLGDMPNGALVFQIEDDTSRILSLYVDQYDRRNGTGRFLIEKLRDILRGVPGVYAVRAALPEGAPEAATFFGALGARLEMREGIARFPLSVLEGSPLLTAPKFSHCIPGTKLDRHTLSYYQRTLEKSGDYLMTGDLWEAPARQDLSWYYMKDKTIQGCAVMTETETGLCLAMLVNQGGTDVLPLLLGSLARSLMETCPPETEISLEAVTPEARTLLERIVPTAVKSTRRVAVLDI